jgi:hypothetical protein
MRKLLLLPTLFFLTSFALNTRVPLHNVYFPHDSAVLNGANVHLVEDVLDRTPMGQSVRFGIMGSFSPSMTMLERNRLSNDRANSLVNLLEALGAEPDHIKVSDRYREFGWPRGEAGAGHEVALQVEVQKGETWTPPRITAINNYLPLPVQTFSIDPRKDAQIVGALGTVIDIPANTLRCTDGSIPPRMDMELTEVYGRDMLVNAGIHTVSDGRMLESGGTVLLEAHCRNCLGVVAPGKTIDLSFPNGGEAKEGMETFIGRRDRNGNFNWEQDRGVRSGGSSEVRERYYINDVEVSREEYMAMRARFEEMEREREAEMAVAKNDEALDAYLLKSSELGWINCDRFYDAAQVTDMIVQVDTALRPSVRLVFDDINSVLAGNYNARTGQVRFSGIPVGEKVRVVGYSIVNDVPYMASQPMVIRENGSETLRLQQTSRAGMEEQLASLR